MRPSRLAFVALLLLVPATAWAHVKWFSRFSFGDRPLTAAEVVTPTVLALGLFTMLVMGVLVVLDRRLADVPWYRRLTTWMEGYRDRSTLVLRVATGAVLLLNWQADAMLVPELPAGAAWVGWFQFAVVLLLLFQRTVPLAGAGLALLYGLGIARFGWFHMLDYLFLTGFAVYFLVSNAKRERVRALRLPALYFTVGFSLCWVALEKLVYPAWGQFVLQENPMLTMGFPVGFFLVGAAFVELALGYLLIIGLLERPFALLITLVFFTTTLVFGKLEVIGHTMLHAALVVFLLEGVGHVYRPPVQFHRRPGLRVAFAALNFALLFAVLLVPYTWGARWMYDRARAGELPQIRSAPGLVDGHEDGHENGVEMPSAPGQP